MVRATCLLVLLSLAASAQAQEFDLSFLPTQAEATDYMETTRYEGVLAFLDVAAAASEQLHLTTFGYTTEGRALPLAVFGDVVDASSAAVRASGKTRILVLGNIHAGEVAGKEAALMLLRSLAAGQHASWADSLVLLIAPIYNADGNERVSLYHRPLQHGPVGGAGQRPNAQGLDLNRDHMKLVTPEARSLVRLLNAYDPHVVIDLHTTNGTVHAYHLTYAPPLHPDTPASLDSLLRQHWLPNVTDALRARHGWETYHYGNVPRRAQAPRGWYTFDHRPRFSTNYVGLRGRFGILSEAYAYATFEERVLVSLRFLEEVLRYAAAHASELRALTAQADTAAVAGQVLALGAGYTPSPDTVAVVLGEVAEERHPYTGERLLRRLDVRRPETMPAFIAFAPTDTVVAPTAYLIPPELEVVRDRLLAHGIAFEELGEAQTLAVERFRIDSVQVADEPFQDRYAHTLYGAYEPIEATLPEGTLRVDTAQPLGRLAVHLLEPQADDGLAAWGLMEEALEEAVYYPIRRIPSLPPATPGAGEEQD